MDTVSVDALGTLVVSTPFLSNPEVDVVDGFKICVVAEVALMVLDVAMIFPCHKYKVTLQ